MIMIVHYFLITINYLISIIPSIMIEAVFLLDYNFFHPVVSKTKVIIFHHQQYFIFNHSYYYFLINLFPISLIVIIINLIKVIQVITLSLLHFLN